MISKTDKMDSEQIMRKALIGVEQGIRNMLDLHHINHDIGTKENEQIERMHSDLLSALEKLREASREEFVEQLKKLAIKG
jgi:hypothetical protein